MKLLLTAASLVLLSSSFVLISWPGFDSELQQLKELLGLEVDQETPSKPRHRARPNQGTEEKKDDLQVELSTADIRDSLVHSHWSRNVEAWLSLVESFIVLLCQLSYAIKNQLVAFKSPY